MSIRTNLETLGRRHHALEREINGEQLHPSCEDLKGAELRRPKSLVKDEIACLGHDAGERASGVKLSAAEKRKEAVRMAKRKSSSWYASATRSIAIIKEKPL
jgi:hypothetical protein